MTVGPGGNRHGTVPLFGARYFFDAAAWVVATVLSTILRFEFDLTRVTFISSIVIGVIAAILQLIAGWYFEIYRGRFKLGGFEEVRGLFTTAFVVAAADSVIVFIFGNAVGVPRSTMLIAFPIALVLMFAVRYVSRLIAERRVRPLGNATPTLIFGAGYLGENLVRRMMTDPQAGLKPVGLIDDDPSKANLQLSSVRVLGTFADLDDIVERTGAEVLIVAIGRADASLLRSIADAGTRVGIAVKVLPPLDEIVSGASSPSDLRDISIEDLIGRQPVDTEVETIAGYLTGKRVLVTGAGGSIGSELCRQIAKFGPSELIMVDHDETGLQSTQLTIRGNGLLDSNEVALADIRDEKALLDLFKLRKPQVVFHAAALKHLPMLEKYPEEAWKTNVIGTLNVLNAAMKVGVTTFVNISTDKAANPTSVLGHSKRVAEKLTVWAAGESGLNFLSVRFGNVIGSRGSMLPTFTYLIETGGPLTVTHPEVSRYFMTISEACQLVVQAGGIGRPGEVLILDMGEPVRILEVAKRMIEMSGKRIEIVFTGLRAGEKLHEDLVGAREETERPFHQRILHTRIDPISPSGLDEKGWKLRLNKPGKN